MAEQNPAPAEALHELHEILLFAALDDTLQRLAATRYTLCRDILLRSDLRSALPGFVQQCMTVYRFRDFIHLYHADVESRMGFIDEALRGCASRARAKAAPAMLRTMTARSR